MKFISEYRDFEKVKTLKEYLQKIVTQPITIMEVCGSHTMAIHRFGIKNIIPPQINLISGPGCPVCVTSIDYIDKAIELAKISNTIITSYGDLIRVPGSFSSLEKERINGHDIRIVYSVLEALDIAKENPQKEIIFLAIGFETTSPMTANAIIRCKNERINNFSILCAHKVMPPPMKALIEEGVPINGYLAPGHVSTITGSDIYEFISKEFGKGVVISGFEPIDIMQSIVMLVTQIQNNEQKVEIQYKRVVRKEGNVKAKELLEEVFEYTSANWRGLGIINNSAFKLKEKYSDFDAEKRFKINEVKSFEPKGCLCGMVLKGMRKPTDCKLFGNKCIPENPVGACMVSVEGACHAYFKYKE